MICDYIVWIIIFILNYSNLLQILTQQKFPLKHRNPQVMPKTRCQISPAFLCSLCCWTHGREGASRQRADRKSCTFAQCLKFGRQERNERRKGLEVKKNLHRIVVAKFLEKLRKVDFHFSYFGFISGMTNMIPIKYYDKEIKLEY